MNLVKLNQESMLILMTDTCKRAHLFKIQKPSCKKEIENGFFTNKKYRLVELPK